MQPQHPAFVRAIPDGPWMRAILAHRKPDGRWLAEMENGALAEVGPDEIRVSAADAPALLQDAARQVERIGHGLSVIPADARNSYYYDACRNLAIAMGELVDAAQMAGGDGMNAHTPEIPRSAMVIDVIAWAMDTGHMLTSNRRGGYTVRRVRPALVAGSTRRRLSR